MAAFRWIDPVAAPLLARHGLDRPESLFGPLEGTLLSGGHRHRETRRLVLDEESDSRPTIYIKRERMPQLKDLLAHCLAGRGWWSKARAEFVALRRLQAAGLGAPTPLACIQESGLWPQAALVIDALPCDTTLAALLVKSHEPAAHDRQELFRQLGEEVSRLHAAGVTQPDLYTNHLMVAREGASWRFWFFDLQRSLVRGRVPYPDRVRNLSALVATLPKHDGDASDRAELLTAYCRAAGLEKELPRIADQVERRAARLQQRSKIRALREGKSASHAPSTWQQLDGGRVWADPEFVPLLTASNLDTLRCVMDGQQGEKLRALADRENWRLVLDAPQAQPRAAYLKKHRSATQRLPVNFGAAATSSSSPGRDEAMCARRLARAGIATLRPIAFGEARTTEGAAESFVLTEELTGYEPLDDFVRQRFPVRAAGARTARDRRLARLILEVGHLAARFHRAGYNHRDFYACHFFVREQAADQFDVRLIDLQRVQHRRRWRRRWIVKDLAQLAYSAPAQLVRCTDRLRFARAYFGVDRLDRRHKRLLRSALAKEHFMRWKLTRRTTCRAAAQAMPTLPQTQS
mgnify:CR=1 FL=1